MFTVAPPPLVCAENFKAWVTADSHPPSKREGGFGARLASFPSVQKTAFLRGSFLKRLAFARL